MPICNNCGVEIDDNLERCPLCRTALHGEGAEPEPEASPPRGRRSSERAATPLARLRLWEIVSLFAGAAAAVVLVADFADGFTVTWARYPLFSILYLWAAGSVLIFLRSHRLSLLLAETAAASVFLLGLDLLMSGQPWFLTLALPITVLAGGLLGGASAVAHALRRRVLAILALTLGTAGLFVLGLEAVLSLRAAGTLRLSWSLVAFGCVVPLVGLLLYVQYRLKVTHSDMRKFFHL